MRVECITVERTASRAILAATVVFEGGARRSQRLWFGVPACYEGFLGVSGNPFVATLLIPAMVSGERLLVDAPVSSKLLAALGKVQDIYGQWVNGASHIEVEARVHVSRDVPMDCLGVGCFVSGGVGSFHTLLKNRDVITHLILIDGLNGSRHRTAIHDEVKLRMSRVAAGLDKVLIDVDTNAGDLCGQYAAWDYYHGSVLAAVGLLWEGLFERLLISASVTYPQLFPWGTHPLLDPLWSTESVEFCHDGCEASRAQKVADWVSRSALVLEALRVCHENDSDKYNCGSCEKCLRTMISLYAVDALGRCATLPTEISLTKVRALRLDVPVLLEMAEENVALLARRKTRLAGELRAALRAAIKRNRRSLARRMSSDDRRTP